MESGDLDVEVVVEERREGGEKKRVRSKLALRCTGLSEDPATFEWSRRPIRPAMRPPPELASE